MKFILTAIVILLLSITAQAQSPVECWGAKEWTVKMKTIKAKPVYLGDELDGGLTVILITPEMTVGVFNISADGKTVCLKATGSDGWWDRKQLSNPSKEREAVY